MSSKTCFCLGVGILFIITIGCQTQTLQSPIFEPPPELINFALLNKGAAAEASQYLPNHLPEEVIDGDISSETWDEGSGWGCTLEHLRTSDLNRRPYVRINLPEPVDIRQIVMYTIDSEQYPAAKYGLKDYRIEYWHGTGWGLIPTGDTKDRQYTARDNTKGKRVHDIRGKLFAQHIRLVPVSTNDTERVYQYMSREKPVYEVKGLGRVMELEVWGYPIATGQAAQKFAQAFAPQAEVPSSDEKLIKMVLTQYEEGYDNANLKKVMSCFSTNYNSNGRTYNDIQTRAADFFQKHHQINMTLTEINLHRNLIDETVVVSGIYVLQYTPRDNGKAERTFGELSLVLADTEEGWKIIRAN
ncbi:discoidin domain-containing protein [Candidatus Poribacteria bacterium]|nr:discoidin domain-containing protein [Candidatus Poribacteria bacterium]